MVVDNQQLREENKKLEEKIGKLTSDHSDQVERQMKEFDVAVKQAKTRVAMMATSESRRFFYATNRHTFAPTETHEIRCPSLIVDGTSDEQIEEMAKGHMLYVMCGLSTTYISSVIALHC